MIDYRAMITLGVSSGNYQIQDNGRGIIIYQQQVSATREGDNYSESSLLIGACDFAKLGIGAKKLKVRLYQWNATPASVKTDTFSFTINFFTPWGINTANETFTKIDNTFTPSYNKEFILTAPVRNGLSPRYLIYPNNGCFIQNISESQTTVLTIQLRMLIDVLEFGGVPSEKYRWY